MPATLTVRDETASGDQINSFPLEFPSERITVRDLIRERVYQEVQDYNRKQDELCFMGLVQPSDAEKVLNENRKSYTYRLPKHRQLDWKEQFEKATDAFGRNGFFILVDQKQAEDLDEEFVFGRGSTVTFVKLVPLVGG